MSETIVQETDVWRPSGGGKHPVRIRVEVASSHFPHQDRNLNTGHPVGTERLSDRRVAIRTVLHDAAPRAG